MLLLSLTEDGNVNPNLDSLESNLGCLQALQFSITQILFKLLKGEKRGKDKKKKKKKPSHGPGKEPFPTDRLWHVSICSYSIKWPSRHLPLVPTTAHLSSLCLLSFPELMEGPQVIRRGQPGVGEGSKAHNS